MRIVQLTPGSGNTFYCENCLRDNLLVGAMRARGHITAIVPLYLPMASDEPLGDVAPIFYGGINVYLQQLSAFFRHTPRWLDKLLDHPRLLAFVSRRAKMTDAQAMGRATISMLQGERGRQVKELDRLTDWLAKNERTDVVSISNALLLGLAGRVKRALNAPVVCWLQDEDVFIDPLPPEQRRRVWELMAQQAANVDMFIAVSRYFADLMAERLGIPAGKIHVVHSGIRLEGREPANPPAGRATIGYLERMCPDKGLDTLIDAFIILRRRADGAASGQPANVRLRVAGGQTADDQPFIDAQKRKLADAGLTAAVEFLPNLDRPAKIEFLRGLNVLSVPARHKEAFGLYVIEALASGVPVVVPEHGAFPEILAATGGGVLCKPDDAESLADALQTLLLDPALARALGQAGRLAVHDKFGIDRVAGEVERLYAALIGPAGESP